MKYGVLRSEIVFVSIAENTVEEGGIRWNEKKSKVSCCLCYQCVVSFVFGFIIILSVIQKLN